MRQTEKAHTNQAENKENEPKLLAKLCEWEMTAKDRTSVAGE